MPCPSDPAFTKQLFVCDVIYECPLISLDREKIFATFFEGGDLFCYFEILRVLFAAGLNVRGWLVKIFVFWRQIWLGRSGSYGLGWTGLGRDGSDVCSEIFEGSGQRSFPHHIRVLKQKCKMHIKVVWQKGKIKKLRHPECEFQLMQWVSCIAHELIFLFIFMHC